MEMHSERIRISNRSGQKLDARIDLPVDRKPVAYALLAHCFTCTKNYKAIANISRGLTAQGIAVVRFDFTGLGESEGDFAETSFSTNVEDLVDVAAYMTAELGGPQILVGHSLGGAAVLQAASSVRACKAVATVGAPFRANHVMHLLTDSIDEIERRGEATVSLSGRPFVIGKPFLDDLRGTKTEEAIAGLGRALLIFHSPVDNLVGVENAAKIFDTAKHPKSYISLDDADHLLSDEADSLYVGTVLGAWSRKYVSSGMQEAKYFKPDDNRIYAITGESGYYTRIMANGHDLVSDEPKAVGGSDAGPSPYDLVVAGLGACTGMTLRMYADRKKWPLKGVTVRLRHEKIHARDCTHCETEEGHIDRIERELELDGPLDEAQRRRLVEIANKCPVHKTLETYVEVVTREAAAP